MKHAILTAAALLGAILLPATVFGGTVFGCEVIDKGSYVIKADPTCDFDVPKSGGATPDHPPAPAS